MAHVGKDGVVKVGSDAVGSVRSFNDRYKSVSVEGLSAEKWKLTRIVDLYNSRKFRAD